MMKHIMHIVFCFVFLGVVAIGSSCSKLPVGVDPGMIDTTAPTVIKRFSDNLSSGVSISAPNIYAIFSERMDPTTINAQNIILQRTGSFIEEIPGTVTYESSSNKAIFTPSTNLSIAETYMVYIKTGVKDIAGNAMVKENKWAFATVAETVPPTPEVVSVYPNDNASSVPINSIIYAIFSKAVSDVSIFSVTQNGTHEPGAITYDSVAKKVLFTPSNPLAYLKTYNVFLAYWRDAEGHQNNTPIQWSFTTSAAP